MSWPKAIVSFFIVIAAVNAFVVYSAISSKTDLIEEQPYEKGLKYDEVIEQLSQANSSGTKPAIKVKGDYQTSHQITITFSPLPTELSNVSVSLKHPAAKNHEDISLKLPPTSPGVFAAEFKPSRSGFWLAEISATNNGTKLLWKDSIVIE